MSKETKVIGALGALFLVIFGAIFFFVSKDSGPKSNTLPTDSQQFIVREDSHQLHKDAKVTLVEFGDYQCPACGAVHPALKQMMAQYGDKVNLVFRNFPLSQHPNAVPGALAAEAAAEQGKFWEMHDKLYETQDEWSTSSDPQSIFAKYAKGLGMDVDKFNNDVKDGKFKDIVNKDRDDGIALQVNSTPTFLIDNAKVPDLSAAKAIIDQELARLEATPQATATPTPSPRP